jgi:hypothetical protein
VKRIATLIFLAATSASAAALPGFALEPHAKADGFFTSLAFDSKDRLYASVTDGRILRLDGSALTTVATVPTAAEGNAAFLGIAMEDDNHAIAHYVKTDMTAEIVSRVDLTSGDVTEVAHIVSNSGRPVSTEHHGGNPSIGPDGTIYFAVGDLGGGQGAQNPMSPAGKIYAIAPGANARVFATGVRNPYDLFYDSELKKLVVSDNGPVGEDEINYISEGDNLGWPLTMGSQPPVDGTVPPVYVFKGTVAPTGMVKNAGTGYLKPAGLLVMLFVPKSFVYFPSMELPLTDPITIMSGDAGLLIDVAQDSKGRIWFVSSNTVYRLHLPIPGDADGNRTLDERDLEAIARETLDEPDGTLRAHEGAYAASWGADANEDGVVDTRDLVALARMLTGRLHAIAR